VDWVSGPDFWDGNPLVEDIKGKPTAEMGGQLRLFQIVPAIGPRRWDSAKMSASVVTFMQSDPMDNTPPCRCCCKTARSSRRRPKRPALTCADINSDGALDLVTANLNDKTVTHSNVWRSR